MDNIQVNKDFQSRHTGVYDALQDGELRSLIFSTSRDEFRREACAHEVMGRARIPIRLYETAPGYDKTLSDRTKSSEFPEAAVAVEGALSAKVRGTPR